MKNLLFTLALLVSFSSFGQTTEQHLDSGISKANLGDYYGAISDFNKSIIVDPNNVQAYWNLADSKLKINDYKGSLSDYNKAISLNPHKTVISFVYYSRASAKSSLEDYSGAINDLTKSIDLDFELKKELLEKYGFTDDIVEILKKYDFRADCYARLNDYTNACSDWEIAEKLGSKTAQGNITKNCN